MCCGVFIAPWHGASWVFSPKSFANVWREQGRAGNYTRGGWYRRERSTRGLRNLAPYAAYQVFVSTFIGKGPRCTDCFMTTWPLRFERNRELSLLFTSAARSRERFSLVIFFYIPRGFLNGRRTKCRTWWWFNWRRYRLIETKRRIFSHTFNQFNISITDGQIYLSPALFENWGFLPRGDVGKSVVSCWWQSTKKQRIEAWQSNLVWRMPSF